MFKILFTLLLLLLSLPPARAQNCGISLGELIRSAAAQGEELELYGEWGDSQESKVPCLNGGGGSNALPVLSWNPEVIKVRIPPGLKPGRYKLGVYCSMGGEPGSGFSTNWVDFDVTKAEDAAAGPDSDQKPLPDAGPEPAPPEQRRSYHRASPEPSEAPATSHCGIALHRPDLLAAAPGDILELSGYWGESQGTKTPFLMGKAVNILTVVSWSSETIRARIPQWLPLGSYKLGVSCDKPGRGQGFATVHEDFELVEKESAALQPKPAGKPRRQSGLPPNLPFWLTLHPKLRDAIIWQGSRGLEDDVNWPENRKAELERYFNLAWKGEPYGLPDPPANPIVQEDDRSTQQGLSQEDALNLYLATVAQSLALEAGQKLPWRLEDTSPKDIATVLSSKEMFTRWENGQYIIDGHKTGTVLPPPPDAGYAFMQDKIGRSRFATIVAVLEWIGREVIHFEGQITPKNMEAQWQYRGFPPATRMIKGTFYHREGSSFSFDHRTAGCTGTSGFLRAVLRCVNIPVRVLGVCGHTTAYFPTEKRYLSHGDDPYTGMRGWDDPCAAAKLLIDEPTFKSWFKRGSSVDGECSKNLGRVTKEFPSTPCPKY